MILRFGDLKFAISRFQTQSQHHESTNRLPLSVIARLEYVPDALLVDQQIRVAAAIYLDAIAVVPFDPPVHFLAVFKHDDHGRAALHLFLKVESFGMGLFGRIAAFHRPLFRAGKRAIDAGIRAARRGQ